MKDKVLEKVESELLVKLDDAFITEHRKIYCYRRPDGSCPAKEFLDNESKRAQAAFAQQFRTHCQGQRLRGDRWHELKGKDCKDLYVYKDIVTQTRIIHTTDEGKIIILLYGFSGKKENKTKPVHITRASALRDEYLARRNEILGRKKKGER